MNTTAEVLLWGTRVGIVHQGIDSPFASFEYDKEFLKSKIELSPIMMPLSDTVYEFPLLSGEPFFGPPGLVADSLPDDFGNKVIERWLSSKGKSLADFSVIDRLCYIGKRGMGALEYVPATFEIDDINERINVSEMVKFASDVLNKREQASFKTGESPTYERLVQVGTSAGGARAKALIAWNEQTGEIRSGQIDLDTNYDYWLMKFDNISKNGDYGLEDIPEYILIEYAYYKMALESGINMSECRLFSTAGENHFMTKRFDRINGQKLHMQSLSAISHISYKNPRVCSYEMAAQYMKRMKLGAKDVEQFYTRMVFNVIAVNQDDHVKNISFLMNKKGEWSLSPAYDVTFAYNPDNRWLSTHQMTVNEKSNNIDLQDLLEVGKNMEINKKKCMSIISRVSEAVSRFETFAEDAGIKEKTYRTISEIIRDNKIDI